jgi:hypothetical protein
MTRLEELKNELKSVNEQIHKEMVKSLHEKVCRVIFKKQSTGEEREMLCTLREDIIPPATKTDSLSQTKVRTLNEEVIAAWDVENQGWRSFRVDSVISFS